MMIAGPAVQNKCGEGKENGAYSRGDIHYALGAATARLKSISILRDLGQCLRKQRRSVLRP